MYLRDLNICQWRDSPLHPGLIVFSTLSTYTSLTSFSWHLSAHQSWGCSAVITISTSTQRDNSLSCPQEIIRHSSNKLQVWIKGRGSVCVNRKYLQINVSLPTFQQRGYFFTAVPVLFVTVTTRCSSSLLYAQLIVLTRTQRGSFIFISPVISIILNRQEVIIKISYSNPLVATDVPNRFLVGSHNDVFCHICRKSFIGFIRLHKLWLSVCV